MNKTSNQESILYLFQAHLNLDFHEATNNIIDSRLGQQI